MVGSALKAMRNLIDAIITLVKSGSNDLSNMRQGVNRINNLGYALEDYVKNLFADSLNLTYTEQVQRWSETFSYIGNDSNPPDMMLKNGDAVEVKKIQSKDAALALNSSYPKQILFSSNPMISQACRDAENWTQKDILYIVGVVSGKSLKHLCMIYGTDYCASQECYLNVYRRIKAGVENIEGIEFSPTRELGRINRVDPLGITYLRMRGMWHIENPWKVFSYIYQRNLSANFNFMCIIGKDKWQSFANRENLIALQQRYSGLKISDVGIRNPDNPAKLNDAKLISYEM